MSSHTKHASVKTTLFLSLAALGVVYGDIGTSPLYAINEIFFGHGVWNFTSIEILGAISIVIWALSIVVAFKYIIFVLRADNDGEGGVFALYGLLDQLKKKNLKWIIMLLVIAAGLLFGDGIITPAISVISSIEGLKIATPIFSPYIVPITIAILTGLFFIQKRGTSKVGTVFGPIVIIWFVSIALLGLIQIVKTPWILMAVNPYYAIYFLLHHQIYTILLTLGSVMLVLTGGEAMYADMGHFGRLPIRLSWFSIVYPALLLNYLGQGAYLLSGQKVYEGNIFYSTAPHWALFPLVIISTFATIIASQALISGAFSLTTQAISLGLMPFLKVVHTHEDHEGQIYVPFINWALFVGCVLLVLIFQSSDRLASAYGLAVSGVMLVTSLSLIFVSKYYWKWHPLKTFVLFVPLTVVDALFLTSNSLKFIEGGYIPLGIGLILLIIMQSWQWGRTKVVKALSSYPRMSVDDLITIKEQNKVFIPRSVIIMTPDILSKKADKIPPHKQLYFERNGLISKHIIFLSVVFQKVPHIRKDRYVIKKFYENEQKGSITFVQLNFGYMEEPNVEMMLEGLANHHAIHIEEDYKDWNIHILYERTKLEDRANIFKAIAFSIFKFLQKNTDTADHYFELGQKQPLSIEIIPVVI